MSRILIVEDELHIAEGLRFNLEAEGYEVMHADTGEAGVGLLGQHEFDLLVLDVMLPGMNGFEVARHLRDSGKFVPILMLTARGRPEDVLSGFAAGADDYLPKPFELPILLARIHGLLRRHSWGRIQKAEPVPAPPQVTAPDVFRFGDKTIDFSRLELLVGDKVIPLTLMEANLLRYLIRHQDKPVSRKAMLEDVWGVREDTDTRAIDNFIVRLRRYIELNPSEPKYLVTVRGVGYRFRPEP
jgi:two-component system, OmpR family, alkaline phosphatase synthesis response regulator PhoP